MGQNIVFRQRPSDCSSKGVFIGCVSKCYSSGVCVCVHRKVIVVGKFGHFWANFAAKKRGFWTLTSADNCVNFGSF